MIQLVHNNIQKYNKILMTTYNIFFILAMQHISSKGREDVISDQLFPAAPITDWDSMPSPEIGNLFDAFDQENDELVFTRKIPRFSADELFKAARRLSSGKASLGRSPTKF